jgi:hypothetical protein
MMACIGEPISWPRLEAFAVSARDTAIAEHVASCRACARCLDEIRGDLVALPPLAVPVPRRRWWRWQWLAPAMAAAAAAVVLLVIWRGGPDPARPDVTRVKGVGEVVLDVVRERGGVIRPDVRSYAPGDRWKVVVTCPPEAAAWPVWIDVAVVDAGAVDHPLAPARIGCGNRVFVPGAFSITGDRVNQVCIRVAAAAAPDRTPPRVGEPGVACVALHPE